MDILGQKGHWKVTVESDDTEAFTWYSGSGDLIVAARLEQAKSYSALALSSNGKGGNKGRKNVLALSNTTDITTGIYEVHTSPAKVCEAITRYETTVSKDATCEVEGGNGKCFVANSIK